MFINFYRRIPDESRLPSKMYFSLDRHKLSPSRALNAHLLAADAAVRRTGFPLALVLLIAIMRTKPVSHEWKIKDLMDGTGLSYKRVHKQLQSMLGHGYCRRTPSGYIFTRRGRRANLRIYAAGLKAIPKATFLIVLDFALFAISPPLLLKAQGRSGTFREEKEAPEERRP